MLIQPGQLTLEQLQAIHVGIEHLTLPDSAREVIRASARVVQAAADGDAPVYGVNTGFGKLANQRISKAQLDLLQLNLIRSHSVGVGAPLQPQVVRLMLVKPQHKFPLLPAQNYFRPSIPLQTEQAKAKIINVGLPKSYHWLHGLQCVVNDDDCPNRCQ